MKELYDDDRSPSPSQLQDHRLLNTAQPSLSTPPTNFLALPILALTASAIIPALMGTLFYISIGFSAPHGHYLKNGTFVRPIDEGYAIGRKDSLISTHFSPLLVSSIASSLV